MSWTKGKSSVLGLTLGLICAAVVGIFGVLTWPLDARDDKFRDKREQPPPRDMRDKGQNVNPAPKAGGQPGADAQFDNLERGVIVKVGDPFAEGLRVQWSIRSPIKATNTVLLLFDEKTTILFADRTKATVADLKPGRWISFKSLLKPDGVYKGRAELVVLDVPFDGKMQPFKVLYDRGVNFPHNALTVSRDRKMIAGVAFTFGSHPQVARVVLVDAETSRVVRELECETVPVDRLVFSPDGKLLYGLPFIWDVATGKRVQQLGSNSWDLSPDGKHLAVVNNFVDIDPGFHGRKPIPPSFSLQVMDTATWKAVRNLSEQNVLMGPVHFSPDGKTLALAVLPRDIRLWDWQAGKDRLRIEAVKLPEATRKTWGDGSVSQLEFSPDGKLLASITSIAHLRFPHHVDLWDASTGKPVRSLAAGQEGASHLTFTPKGDQIALMDLVKVRLIDTVTGKAAKELPGQVLVGTDLVTALYHHGLAPEQAPDAAPVFRRLWNVATGEDITAGRTPNEPQVLAFAPDGRTLAIRDKKDRVWLVDALTGKEVPQGALDIRRLLEGAQAGPVFHRAKSVFCPSPDGKTTAACAITGWFTMDKTVRLLDAAGKQFGELPLKGVVYDVHMCFTPDGRGLFVQQEDGIRFWEVASQQMRAFIPDRCPRAVSPKGRLLVCRCPYGKPLNVWDLTGRNNGGILDSSRLTDLVLTQLWADLQADAAKAYPAMWRLAGASTQSVPLLEKKVADQPAPGIVVALRIVEVLEQSDTPEARRLLKLLARPDRRQFHEAAQAALDRLN